MPKMIRTEIPGGFKWEAQFEENERAETVEIDGLGELSGFDENSYFLFPRGNGMEDYGLFYPVRHEEDFTQEISESSMPVFGVKTKEKCFLAVVTGMAYDYTLRVTKTKDVMRCPVVFILNGEAPEENPQVEYYPLAGEDADYSGMARLFRKLEMQRHDLTLMKDRARQNKELAYALDSVLLRVRMGWKPAPSPVPHQTRETEPEMHVACTFQRVGEMLDELKAQGVEKAEISLVGWNIRGHDGRWPEAFPVEEKLGGEEKLRQLIRKAQDMGYAITCHTNSTDQYEIAENYDVNNTRTDREGRPVENATAYSAGAMYQLCPQVAWEQAQETLPRVRELGFRGLHYIDVLGLVHPRRCYHPAHPVTSGQAVKYAENLAKMCHELFGGFASESARSFIAPYTDYAYTVGYSRNSGLLCDESVPFYSLVYHGCLMFNPYIDTENGTFKARKNVLLGIEYGARPAFYFYRNFYKTDWNEIRTDEPRMDTDEILRDTVSKIKARCDMEKQLTRLHTCTMEKHRRVSENVYEATYSDGTVVRVDYGKETFQVIPPEGNK